MRVGRASLSSVPFFQSFLSCCLNPKRHHSYPFRILWNSKASAKNQIHYFGQDDTHHPNNLSRGSPWTTEELIDRDVWGPCIHHFLAIAGVPCLAPSSRLRMPCLTDKKELKNKGQVEREEESEEQTRTSKKRKERINGETQDERKESKREQPAKEERGRKWKTERTKNVVL